MTELDVKSVGTRRSRHPHAHKFTFTHLRNEKPNSTKKKKCSRIIVKHDISKSSSAGISFLTKTISFYLQVFT